MICIRYRIVAVIILIVIFETMVGWIEVKQNFALSVKNNITPERDFL